MTVPLPGEWLFQSQTLLLQCQPGDGGQGSDPMAFLLPLVIVIGIFWFLVFRPEQRQRKERELKVKALRKGDRVVTSSGILGDVTRIEEQEVVLRVDKDKDVRMRFTKAAILDVLSAETSADRAGESTQEAKV